MRKIAVILLIMFIAACSPTTVSVNITSVPTKIPDPTPTVELAKTPDGKILDQNGNPLPVPTATLELVSYLFGLDITETDSNEENPIYQGVNMGEVTIGVDESLNGKGVHSVDMTGDSRLNNTAARAWFNLIHPENTGTDAELTAFMKTWAEVQAGGEGADCSKLAVTFDAFGVGGGPKQTLTVVPNCGKAAVPEGAIQISNFGLVFANLFITGSDGAAIENSNTPWMDKITATGNQAGLLVDHENGKIIIFIDPGMMMSGPEQKRGDLADSLELTLAWLQKFVVDQNWELKRIQNYTNRAYEWETELIVK